MCQAIFGHANQSGVGKISLLGLFLLLSLTPGRAGATDGKFFLGLDFLSSHIGADDPRPDDPSSTVYADETGAGAAFQLGVSLTSTFKLRLYFSGARHETNNPDVELRLGGGSLEALYMFSPDDALRPYLFGGIGAFRVESAQDQLNFSTDGPGATFGAGLHYFLGRHIALNFALRGEWINWDTSTAELILPNGSRVVTETPVEDSGFAGKFTLGLGFWF